MVGECGTFGLDPPGSISLGHDGTETEGSQPFVEYLHLARFGDRWLIVNALYYELA